MCNNIKLPQLDLLPRLNPEASVHVCVVTGSRTNHEQSSF